MRSLMIARSRASLAGALLVTLSLTVLWDRHAAPTAAQGPPSCVAPPSGLVSWWPGDGSASDFRDGNPGTLVNGATFAPGKVGLGFSLDGVDDRVEIPDAANLKPANVTVETWVKFDALDTPGASLPGLQYIVFKRNSRTSSFEGYALVKIRVGGVDRLRFVIASASGVQVAAASTTAVAAGQFYHVAGSYDGATAKLYVNGVLEDQQAASFPLDYGTRPVFIGSSEEGHNGRLKGVVDEASIYNRALSAAEIQAIVAADNAGKCRPACVAPASGLVSWWPGDGQAVDIQDGNHGTLLGGTFFTQAKVGQGLTFDSDDDRVTIPHNTNLDINSPGFTGEFWMRGVKNQPQSVYNLVEKSHGYVDSTGWSFQGTSATGTVGFGVGAGGPASGNFPGVGTGINVLDGNFHHIAGTWDGANIRLYIDGVLQGATPLTTPFNNNRAVNIGYAWGGGTAQRFFRGTVDELSIYNRALTAAEIQAIFNAGSAGKCKSPVVQFDGRGTFLHTAAGDVPAAPPAIVDLGALGFAPGDSIRLSFTVQNFSFVSCSGPFNVPGVHAVFSNSNTLLAPSNFARVPGAIEAGNDIVTPPTGLGNEPTDIPQDFQVFLTNGSPIQIPLGATHLFIGVIDTLYYDNCGKVIVTIERIAADLEITQSVSPDPVTTGSDLTYQLLVKNNGPSAATSVTVTDNLPASTTFVSCAATGGSVCGGSGNNRTVTFSSLAPGASATITLVAKVNCSVANDTMIGNTATVSSATSDTNSSNNSTTATVTASNPKPALTAPPAVNVAADTTQCGKTVDDATLGTATASDNCPGVTITRSGVPANNFFPVGTTTIIYTATDAGGNTATTSQTVTVSDNTLPTITAPAPITVATGAGSTSCGVTISDATLGTATASDNCGSAPITRSGVPAGNLFPVGVTTITYTATDLVGNVATATQTITVTDNTPPIINAPATVSISTGAGATACGTVISDAALGNAAASDNCGSGVTVNRSGVPTGNLFPVGATTITYTATDGSGNTTTATQTVTVTDNTAPTITASPAVNANADPGACAATGVGLGTPTTGDNCGVASVVNNAPSSFPLGATTVTWTVTDVNGNTATATQIVTVSDNQKPILTAPAPLNLSTGTGAMTCGVTISDSTLGAATASDNCGTASVSRSGVPAGNIFPVGTTTITYTATDGSGNTATVTQTVTVTDNTAPSIAAPPTVNINANAGSCAATGVSLGTPTTGDNCGVASTVNNAPSSFPIGTTIVTWTVTDANGNTATATQTVTVTDNQRPSIIAPAPLNVATGTGATSCGVVLSDAALGAATASDNCGTANVTRSGVPAGNFFPVGTTTLTYTATDAAGNTQTATQIVTVVDNTVPTITSCPANINIAGNILGSCSANVNPGVTTATDNCAGVSVAGVRSDGQPLSAAYPLGVTTIIWTARDAANNTVSCQQTVTVTNPAPVATITGPETGSAYAVGATVNFAGSFTDNAGGTHTATWTFDAVTSAGTVNETTSTITGSHTFTAAGVYAVKLTVNDGCGGAHTTDLVGPDGLAMLVVVYDPSAGWVTGGGWINSPAGAYFPDPTLTGKANFGFVSKYQNGATVPTGNTEFHFKAGNLKFQSTSYEWMVIAGARAQYKGAGKINGAGDYRFMLTAIDGQQPGGGGQDKFRIRIWDNSGGGLVYDNQMSAPDNADPTTVLGGGSIVVHK